MLSEAMTSLDLNLNLGLSIITYRPRYIFKHSVKLKKKGNLKKIQRFFSIQDIIQLNKSGLT